LGEYPRQSLVFFARSFEDGLRINAQGVFSCNAIHFKNDVIQVHPVPQPAFRHADRWAYHPAPGASR
jgi:hypothetical protein